MNFPHIPTGKSPRRELQGPRPTPLRIHKDSHKIKKPPLPPQPSQPQPPPRQPVIIYTVSPKIIHTTPADFRNLVQSLTGSSSSSSSDMLSNDPFNGNNGDMMSPAARYATVEKARSPHQGKKQLQNADTGVVEGIEMGHGVERPSMFHGILSPGPTSLSPIPSSFFSAPSSDPSLVSFLHDLSPVLHRNRNFLEENNAATKGIEKSAFVYASSFPDANSPHGRYFCFYLRRWKVMAGLREQGLFDKRAQQGKSAISVDDSLKIIACKEQRKKLDDLEMELAAARQEGFTSKYLAETNGTYKASIVIGILTRFGRQNNRDAIRKTWMGSGADLKKLEDEKGIIARFVIGRSANRGESQDRDIDREKRQTNDFIIFDNLVEANEELPKKAKLFFAHAADKWDAEFYAKVNDDVYVYIGNDVHMSCSLFISSCADALGATLATHLDKPRVYIGCMKSGEVVSEQNQIWYETEWRKFGDKKSYFRHASGEMYVISQELARFISVNRYILGTYAHDDVSAGSWFIGLDVKHVDERKFCCSSWSAGLSHCSISLRPP